MGRGKRVSPGEELAQGGEVLRAFVGHQMEQARGEPEGRDAAFPDDLGQFRQCGDGRLHDRELSAVEQCPPDFKCRRVE